jgi:ankyrin repeat protein
MHYHSHLNLRERSVRPSLQSGLYTPLEVAAKEGHTGVVTMLIKAGADVNYRDNKVWYVHNCALLQNCRTYWKPFVFIGGAHILTFTVSVVRLSGVNA